MSLCLLCWTGTVVCSRFIQSFFAQNSCLLCLEPTLIRVVRVNPNINVTDLDIQNWAERNYTSHEMKETAELGDNSLHNERHLPHTGSNVIINVNIKILSIADLKNLSPQHVGPKPSKSPFSCSYLPLQQWRITWRLLMDLMVRD